MKLFPAFYVIAYDLHEPEKNYPKLEAKLSLLEDQFRVLESTWLVKTKRDSTEILKLLGPALDDNDHIFIVEIKLSERAGLLPLAARTWLLQNTTEL